MNDTAGDLVVTELSDALKGRRIDVVVSDRLLLSKAAVEGVRLSAHCVALGLKSRRGSHKVDHSS